MKLTVSSIILSIDISDNDKTSTIHLLTFPSNCISCTHLADRIVELKECMFKLYPIQKAERLMDIIIFGPACTNADCAPVPNTTTPSPVVETAY